MIKYVYNAEGKLYSYESSDFIEHNKSKIYRTDLEGSIEIKINKYGYKIKSCAP